MLRGQCEAGSERRCLHLALGGRSSHPQALPCADILGAEAVRAEGGNGLSPMFAAAGAGALFFWMRWNGV